LTAILILTVLTVVYTLYVGKELILPIALALVLKLLLQPTQKLLHLRLQLPGTLAAAVIIVAVFGAIGTVILAISIPASGWIEKAPEIWPMLKEKLSVLRQPIEILQNALKEIENLTTPTGQDSAVQTVALKPATTLPSYLATGTAKIVSRVFTTLIVLFFLLAAGDRLVRGFVEVLPRFSEKRQVVEIATEIEQNITGYLLTVTMMNSLVGIATGLAMWACGLGTPLLGVRQLSS